MHMVVRSGLAIITAFVAVAVTFLTIGYIISALTGIAMPPIGNPERYTPVSLITTLIRLLSSISIGGFVASFLAGEHRLGNATILGGMMLLLALFDGPPPTDMQPMWFTILTLVLIVPSAVSGGFVRRSC